MKKGGACFTADEGDHAVRKPEKAVGEGREKNSSPLNCAADAKR